MDQDTHFTLIAAEAMAWDDGNWTGTGLEMAKAAILQPAAGPELIKVIIKDAYRSFIWGRDREDIVIEDMRDRFVDDAEYQEYLDWAQAL